MEIAIWIIVGLVIAVGTPALLWFLVNKDIKK